MSFHDALFAPLLSSAPAMPSEAMGRLTVNAAPPAGRLAAWMEPPCCRTMPSQTNSPSPVEPRPEKNGSKIRPSVSSGMPGLASSTNTWTCPSWAAPVTVIWLEPACISTAFSSKFRKTWLRVTVLPRTSSGAGGRASSMQAVLN